jgi:hypothetical protein
LESAVAQTCGVALKEVSADPKKWLVVVQFAFYDALRRFLMMENVRRAVGGFTWKAPAAVGENGVVYREGWNMWLYK